MAMASILNKVTQGVQKLTSHTLTEASKVKEKILNDGQTNDESLTFTSLWEIPEPIEYCRGCEVKFTTRKHHCRSCAGVFCDDCAPSNVPSSTFEEDLISKSLNLPPGAPVRICNGCKRGECPSRSLIETIRYCSIYCI
ncbi:hypothetical protein EON64_14955 [archaeon]|nr:MAG: hypothetical protein EON64_14955 [archaeon]